MTSVVHNSIMYIKVSFLRTNVSKRGKSMPLVWSEFRAAVSIFITFCKTVVSGSSAPCS
jgi:hypothetical protein